MGACVECGRRSPLISAAIGACAACLRAGAASALAASNTSHRRLRTEFGLPKTPPLERGGVACDYCARSCRISAGSRGYCGIHANQDGRLIGGDAQAARAQFYHDPLPTNCVADWVCPATGCGYPKFSFRSGTELGYTNLALFYEACSIDCLFCQNWQYRYGSIFAMHDLPCTSASHAQAAEAAARKAGLKQVRIGNSHVHGNAY